MPTSLTLQFITGTSHKGSLTERLWIKEMPATNFWLFVLFQGCWESQEADNSDSDNEDTQSA